MVVSCILLTTHPNRADYLPDAIRSYYAQTYPHKELVVVNDGPQAIEPWGPDVTVVNLPYRRTIGEKRNIGLRAAKGDYIATWDDDDISLPSRLAEQVEAVEQREADAVLASSMYIADHAMRVLGRVEMGSKQPIQASAMILRNAAVLVGGYQPMNYGEDAEMIGRIKGLFSGHKVSICLSADWYVMRRHPLGITMQYDRSDYWEALAARDPHQPRAQAMVDQLRSLPLPLGVPQGRGASPWS